MELSAQQREDVIELQNLQQQLQFLSMQRQQMELQVSELTKAGDEVTGSNGQLYRFVGSVIVPKEKASLKKELEAEKESIALRQGTFGKQEEKLKERFMTLRKKLEAVMGKGGGGFNGQERFKEDLRPRPRLLVGFGLCQERGSYDFRPSA